MDLWSLILFVQFLTFSSGQTCTASTYLTSTSATCTNNGTLEIGGLNSDTGKSDIVIVTLGGYIQGSNGNLLFDWGSGGMDELDITGDAQLDGLATINVDSSWSKVINQDQTIKTMIECAGTLTGNFGNLVVGTEPSCVIVQPETHIELPGGSNTKTKLIVTFTVTEDGESEGCSSAVSTATITAVVAGCAILVVVVIVIILCVRQSLRRKREAANLSKTTAMSATLVEPPPEAVKATAPPAVSEPVGPAGSWKIGDFCLAAWSEDGQWYRGQLQQWDPVRGAWLCLFSDYGNQDWVKPADLLPDESRQRP